MIKPHLKTIVAIFILIALIAIPGESISQERNQTSPGPVDSGIEAEATNGISLDKLKAMQSEAENTADLAEDIKNAVMNFLDRANTFKDSENRLRRDLAEGKKKVENAPERIKAIETELDRPQAPPDNVVTAASNMNPDQRESHLMQLEADLSESTTNLTELTDRLNALNDQPSLLQEEIGKAKQRYADIAEELKAIPAPDDPPLLVGARQAALLTEQNKIQSEIELFENQLTNHAAITALLSAERDLAARTVAQRETLNDTWQTEVQRLRELEAKQQVVVAQAAKKLAADLPPVVQKQYDVTIELGKMLEKITLEEAQILESLELKQAQLKQLEEDFVMAHEQIEYPWHTEALGLALREQRRTLPSMEHFRRDSDLRRVQMGELRGLLLDLDRRRRELADLDNTVDEIIQNESEIKDTDVDFLKTELRRLLSDRREIVKKLQAGSQRMFKNFQRLEFIEQQIATKAQQEALFLDEHLLWIRSAKSIGLQDLRDLLPALKWILSPHNWRQAAQHLLQSVMRTPVLWMLGLLISMTLVGLRRWAHRDLSRVARNVYSVKTDAFVLTLRAMALTARASFGWPLLFGLAGWQLGRMSLPDDFASAVGVGLLFSAQTLAGSLFLYEMCSKYGVAKVHFKWPESVRKTVQRNLRWFVPLLVTMSFIFITVQTRNIAAYTNSLGRLVFVILMLGFFVWVAWVLRYSGEIVSMLKRRKPGGWLVRLSFIWYPLAMGVPLTLIFLAGTGYYYSASALYLRMGETIALILGLIIVKDLVLRWLSITQRRLTYEEIKRKKEAEIQKQIQEEEPGTVEHETFVIEEPEINLDQIYEKNQKLLRTIIFFSALVGLWWIWANVLPALNVLEYVEVWTYTSEIDGVRKIVPTTLADLIAAVIVAIVTIVAAKNLPGLLEIILLKRFSLDYGARHAYTTIFSYVIITLGLLIAFTKIGIKWSNLQWLIAALSVGLGFGLQEIVANFICGLIVLFERPFRIGDTVTIADISGTVTRIQIRATTIMDWDRKELIVPNKEFITGRLVNWSLSDNIIRIKIPIGIAYGSDTELAEKLLLNAAKASPLVIENPEPRAVFLGFGDNSLQFELRVFINDLNNWIPMLHKLNQTIDRKFREADITISFPQRDVHLDQTGPLEVRVVSVGDKPS